VEALEQQVQHLRKEATFVAGHRAFKSLTDFRRQLADAKWLLDDTQWEVETGIKSSRLYWDVDGRALSAEEFWSEKREAPMVEKLGRAKSIDVRDIPDLLKELEGRISTMTQTVNEEIQIVVGSVQVEDARIMKRQTEWTVVLAVLAAIYLPMSLVTGIFGMNITDLSADISAPDKWTVVRTWAVIFGTTMASILVYALVRLILRYWRISRMLLRRRIEEIHDGRLSTRIFIFGQRIENLWLYRKIHGFWQKMREWDLEAQKIEKLE
jgi:Mg2+ and Co2+ transporter CorA